MMNKESAQITFVIFTYNEEKRIEFPIKNYRGFGDILIVDNESTDHTREVAVSAGARVITYKNPGWVETKDEMEFIFKHISSPWICMMSADEMIPRTCLEYYQKIVNEDRYKVVIQNKKTLLYQSGTDFIPGYINIHFFRKGALEFTGNKMHQRGKLSPTVKQSDVLYLPPIDEYSVYHFSLYNSKKMVKTVDTYSDFQSEMIPGRFLGIKVFLVPMYQFLFYFFAGRLFLIGVRGFITAVELSLYYFFAYAKAYERHKKITLASIEKDFQKDKKFLLEHSPQSNMFQKAYATFVLWIISNIHRQYKKQ